MESNSRSGMCMQICTTKVGIFVWTLQVLGGTKQEHEVNHLYVLFLNKSAVLFHTETSLLV